MIKKMEGRLEIQFRGMKPNDELSVSARQWWNVIIDGISWEASPKGQLFVNRCALEWGGSTTAQIELWFADQKLVEIAQHQDPYEALQESFRAIASKVRAYHRFTGSEAGGEFYAG